MQAAGRKYIWYPSRTTEIKLVYFSDIHWFAKACSEKSVLAQVREIRDDPATFWIGGGDYGEFIGYQDSKRFDPDAVSERVKVKDLGRLGKATYESLRDVVFNPIKHKCLGLLMGNHERAYMNHTQQGDLHGWLCTELGVPNLGYSCLMDVICVNTKGTKVPCLGPFVPPKCDTRGSTTFRVFCHHGAGAAQTKGGKINRLVSFMRIVEADIYIMGHVHDQMGARLTPLTANADCTKITNSTKIGVISGSYLKTYAQGVTSYGEQKGYEPTTLGAAHVQIRPDTREVWGRV